MLIATPVAPLAEPGLVMTGTVDDMVIVTIWPALVSVLLVAVTVVLYEPSVVGVPEIKPVLVLTDKPGGKLDAL